MPPKCGYHASLINAYHGRVFGAPDLHGMVTVAITYGRTTVDTVTVRSPTFYMSRDISTIAALPPLEHLHISVTKKAMENYIPPVGNDFPAITRLASESETIDACQVMLVKIKSKMLRSLVFT